MRQFFTGFRLSLLLTTLAFLLWSPALVQSELNIGRYGLISSYSPLFFLSLGILTVAAAILWLSRENHHWLLGLQTALLIVSLYLTPQVLEGTTRFPAAYQNYGFVEYVLRNARLNPQQVWYHGWPGFPLLFTVVFQITGIQSPLVIMGVFPAVMEAVYLLPLFLIYRTVTGGVDNRWWAVAWIFVLINWTNQDYFSPQAIAYLFLLLTVAILLKEFKSGTSGTAGIVLLVVLLAGITLTHLVTAVVALLLTAILSLVWKRRDFSITALLAVFIGAWTVYGSFFQLRVFLPRFVEEAFRADLSLLYTYLFRFEETSAEHAAINNLRVVFTGLCLLMALLGFALMKGERRFSRSNVSLIAIIISPVLLMPMFVYSGEFVIRVYLMLLVPAAYFAGKLLTRKTTAVLLTALLIVLVPFHMVVQYGNEIIERVPETEVQFSQFFFDHTSGGRLIALVPPVLFHGIEKYSHYATYAYTPDPEFGRLRLAAVRVLAPEYPAVYFESCRRLYDVFDYGWNDPRFLAETLVWVENWDGYNRVYSNGDVNLYIWQQAGR